MSNVENQGLVTGDWWLVIGDWKNSPKSPSTGSESWAKSKGKAQRPKKKKVQNPRCNPQLQTSNLKLQTSNFQQFFPTLKSERSFLACSCHIWHEKIRSCSRILPKFPYIEPSMAQLRSLIVLSPGENRDFFLFPVFFPKKAPQGPGNANPPLKLLGLVVNREGQRRFESLRVWMFES